LCNNCNCGFELFLYIKDYTEHPQCPQCNKNTTDRDYSIDMLTLNSSVKKSDTELKTIGDLANRNRDRMSDDEKNALYIKHNSYKEEVSDKPLPKGMTRLKKQNKVKWT